MIDQEQLAAELDRAGAHNVEDALKLLSASGIDLEDPKANARSVVRQFVKANSYQFAGPEFDQPTADGYKSIDAAVAEYADGVERRRRAALRDRTPDFSDLSRPIDAIVASIANTL